MPFSNLRQRVKSRYAKYQTGREIAIERKIKKLQEKDERQEEKLRLNALRDEQLKRYYELKNRTRRKKSNIKVGKKIVKI